jgi:hypothetical protein
MPRPAFIPDGSVILDTAVARRWALRRIVAAAGRFDDVVGCFLRVDLGASTIKARKKAGGWHTLPHHPNENPCIAGCRSLDAGASARLDADGIQNPDAGGRPSFFFEARAFAGRSRACTFSWEVAQDGVPGRHRDVPMKQNSVHALAPRVSGTFLPPARNSRGQLKNRR